MQSTDLSLSLSPFLQLTHFANSEFILICVESNFNWMVKQILIDWNMRFTLVAH